MAPPARAGTTKKKNKVFPFLKLPPEIRNSIYEYCVRPTAFLEDDDDDGCRCDILTQSLHDRACPLRSKQTRLFTPYIKTRHVSPVAHSLFLVRHENYKPPRLQYRGFNAHRNMLLVNRQIRSEALPMFYGANLFTFEDASYMARWLFNICGWENIKHIRRMYGVVCGVDGDVWDDPPTWVSVIVVLLLMEVGILKCELWLDCNQEDGAIAQHQYCRYRERVKALIDSKGITKENTSQKPADLKRFATELLYNKTTDIDHPRYTDQVCCRVCGKEAILHTPLLIRSPYFQDQDA
ncbi:hypothetical protein Q7P37_000426 [Cladosporium fusiforme]